MTMSSALSAGVSGLSANAMRLATISDNIANSSTYGYKRVETEFDAMVLVKGTSTGVYAAGGVRATSHRIIEQNGSLIGTSNPLDIAISGRGMLPVTTAVALDNKMADLPMLMTRTGSFRPDANGILRTESGLVLMGWPANSDGSIPLKPRDTITGLQPIKIDKNQTASDPTRNIFLNMNLPASETRDTASGEPINMSIEYFGNLGTSETLTLSFTPTIPDDPGLSNTWLVEIRDSAGNPPEDVIETLQIVFDDAAGTAGTIKEVRDNNGNAHGNYDPDTGRLNFDVAGGPMSLEIGKINGVNGMRQLSSSFATTNVTKDGSPVGNLASVEIDPNGLIRATYDTGFIKVLYQVPLADVANPNGLIALDDQTFKISPTSGSFFLWDAGDGPTGEVVGYAREESTTDVADELTSLIVTQRAYSSNAKVIQTVDEMLQETTNIKR
ncbi:MAG: flagellar hook-basal body complex protein [Paracoccus sp. (in: a-proteobacteria)]|uniref:flagellar hook protein FlgE n=1 Tax=Paracoccus sp. TaxID=267 RepID=UPI0026DF3826|nr:flagellar hook-basal body complex protein [Paracoccus sp. (in: a-proteobacteria)]MDO5632166.1 flagellar hook-basal body complex protein [Paracoccus sp. (in: a-proteobacteria)]